MKTNKHSPLPWRWAHGWKEKLPRHDEDYEGEKYADLALLDAQGEPVIPIRVDHYCYELDFPNNTAPITRANRDLILAAVNAYSAPSPELIRALVTLRDSPGALSSEGRRTIIDSAIRYLRATGSAPV